MLHSALLLIVLTDTKSQLNKTCINLWISKQIGLCHFRFAHFRKRCERVAIALLNSKESCQMCPRIRSLVNFAATTANVT